MPTRAVDWVMARQARRRLLDLRRGRPLAVDRQPAHGLQPGDHPPHRRAARTPTAGMTAWRAGLAYYRRHLFEDDGTPRYYSTTRWPLDPHSFAQGALTFLRLQRFSARRTRSSRAASWRAASRNCGTRSGADSGFQKHARHAQRIIHMRWSQAWMLRALCAYLATVVAEDFLDELPDSGRRRGAWTWPAPLGPGPVARGTGPAPRPAPGWRTSWTPAGRATTSLARTGQSQTPALPGWPHCRRLREKAAGNRRSST